MLNAGEKSYLYWAHRPLPLAAQKKRYLPVLGTQIASLMKLIFIHALRIANVWFFFFFVYLWCGSGLLRKCSTATGMTPCVYVSNLVRAGIYVGALCQLNRTRAEQLNIPSLEITRIISTEKPKRRMKIPIFYGGVYPLLSLALPDGFFLAKRRKIL